jgi:hypothetical protein
MDERENRSFDFLYKIREGTTEFFIEFMMEAATFFVAHMIHSYPSFLLLFFLDFVLKLGTNLLCVACNKHERFSMRDSDHMRAQDRHSA